MARSRYTISIANEPAVAETMKVENSFDPKIGTNLVHQCWCVRHDQQEHAADHDHQVADPRRVVPRGLGEHLGQQAVAAQREVAAADEPRRSPAPVRSRRGSRPGRSACRATIPRTAWPSCRARPGRVPTRPSRRRLAVADRDRVGHDHEEHRRGRDRPEHGARESTCAGRSTPRRSMRPPRIRRTAGCRAGCRRARRRR